ncbi:MAG: transporter [Deltaproteobacteria bacterium]|nr:transporter [Deltaproteobacteria bacterium]
MPQETTSRFAEALITDRPDAAEASQTVGKNRFQVETSFAYGHDHDAGVTTRNYCFPTLLRFGILGPLEVRLEGEMYSVQTEAGAATQRGISDLAVGLKAHWLDNRGWGPSLGTLAHLSVPTGSNNFSSNAVEPIFKILADWELPADFSLGINAGVDLPARDAVGDKFARFLYAAAVGHPTPFWKERMRIFVEASGAVQLKAAKSAEQTFDTGLALLITPDIQVDGFVQLGLTEASPGLQTGLGFSWRL